MSTTLRTADGTSWRQPLPTRLTRLRPTTASSTRPAPQVHRIVSGLEVSGPAIGDKVNVGHDTASETIRLSLAATVEAARGRDAGRGMAVVAHGGPGLAKAPAHVAAQLTGFQELATLVGQALGGIEGHVESSNAIEAVLNGVPAEPAAVARALR